MGRVCDPSPFGYGPVALAAPGTSRSSRGPADPGGASPGPCRTPPRSVRRRPGRLPCESDDVLRAASPRRCGGPASSAAPPASPSPVSLSVRLSLRRLVSSVSLPSFPRPVPTSGAALRSAGSLGPVPPLHRSYCGATTSGRPDRARFPSHGRSRSRSGDRQISQVPGQPLPACHGRTPRRSRRAF
jgi:hypothetical protein